MSTWDVLHAVDLAITAFVTCTVVTWITPLLMGRPAEPVGILWAVISAVFVFRDTLEQSRSAATSRILATFISFALCQIYLLLFAANSLGLSVLIVIGTLLLMLAGRRNEIGLLAITTAVIMIVAAEHPETAWQQPLLRLADTAAGVVVGAICKWIASSLYDRLSGQDRR
ncbi:FUSC family protein [Bradyrhizobium mercantei]|uniref:FUSC family protein n=1 Tax=Bradyrhizobium mercantei TaxID=1904807 RepID=UPI0011773F78|nr:FUSC family protein [Bradyrhizobium mercantei]